MATVTYTDDNGVVTRVLTNTYNGNGQLHSIHDSATGRTLYGVYDGIGRLVSANNGDVYETYTYDHQLNATSPGKTRGRFFYAESKKYKK